MKGMSHFDSPTYSFADFQLDTAERSLVRNGNIVAITPKVFETLLVLLRRAGHIVEKDELMREIWHDRFVDESNLSFNIRMLRKALGDEATAPVFIETIPRRGYRFIAPVRPQDETNSSMPSRYEAAPAVRTNYGRTAVFAAFSITLLALVVGGSWYLTSRYGSAKNVAPPLTSERLSTNGGVFQAVVSPDGSYVAYTNLSGNKQSVWLRQLETSSNLEIVPAVENQEYGGLTFSPSGEYVYFTRYPKGNGRPAIYRVSVRGGVSKLIVDNTLGRVSISPDGSKVAFLRRQSRNEGYRSLMIADAADGQNERELLRRDGPVRITDNKFSDDGRSIVFAYGQSENQANDFSIAVVNIETGKETAFSSEKFFEIRSLDWLPGKRDLLVAASRIPNRHFRLWKVSPGDDLAEPLTSESESYGTVSASNNGNAVVGTLMRDDYTLAVYDIDSIGQRRELATANTAAFTPHDKIIFSSAMLGNLDIWIMNKDGRDQRQLSTDPADDSSPIVSPNGDAVFFTSNRTGSAHVWRMNSDGSNETQISKEDGGFPLLVSPDGAWVYYRSAIRRHLMRVPAAGGTEELVSERTSFYPALSADAERVAYIVNKGPTRTIEIVSASDGRVLKALAAPVASRVVNLTWSRDGKNLFYIVSDGDQHDQFLYLHPVEGGQPRKIGQLGEDHVESISVAPDGRSLAIVQGKWKHDAVLLRGLNF